MTMTIPFLHYFKRKPVKEHPVVARVEQPPVEKSSTERLSKTVIPNATRAPGQDDPFPIGNGRSSAGSRAGSSLNPSGVPPAVALALEPKVERVIALDLADVVEQMPNNLIRPLQEADAGRRVCLKAAEIEKGMASAKPTVSIATIYEQVPEIFLQRVPADDTRQVPLPFAKVVEEFSKLQLRSDQYREQSVPQMETPFLQVTLEDNTRFGIVTTEPIQTGDLPSIDLQLAPADGIAAAEPGAAMREKFSLAPRPTIAPAPLRASTPAPAKPLDVPPTPEEPRSAPARIAFKITPNGTDVPAPEKVPASTGPSVPTSSPAPKRIPFQIAASSDEPGAEGEPWLTKESLDAEGTVTPESETFAPKSSGDGSEAGSSQCKISLPLKPILQSLPPFQLTGDIAGVSDDARVELPFSLVEPQLMTGRVTLQPDEFALALPEEYRGLFSTKDIATPVALSLQDVLKNLPTASLRIREDQESEEKGGNFATPFSAKAEEDAKRFSRCGEICRGQNGTRGRGESRRGDGGGRAANFDSARPGRCRGDSDAIARASRDRRRRGCQSRGPASRPHDRGEGVRHHVCRRA